MEWVGKLPYFKEALYLCAALLPLSALAADPANLQGMWKISAPQVAFKPEGGSIPFTAKGRKAYRQNERYLAKRDYQDFDYATARCASPGVPRIMLTPERLRVWQRPEFIGIQFEWNRLYRQIDMGGLFQPQLRASSSPVSDSDDVLVGRAIPIAKGHWEGDTLVATSENFPSNTLIDNAVPHGQDMKLTERFRLRSADVLEDRIRIEDPEYFTKPWETVVTYQRQPDEIFPENICIDSRLPADKYTRLPN